MKKDSHLHGSGYAIWKIEVPFANKKAYYETKKRFDQWYAHHKKDVIKYKKLGLTNASCQGYQFTPSGWVKV